VELALGEKEVALAQLERALESRSGWIAYAGADPRLDPLRSEQRFRKIADAVPRPLVTLAPQRAPP